MTTLGAPLIEPIYDVRRVPGHTKWTREQFHRAIEMGLWAPEDKLELIYGELVQKMGMNGPHATVILLLQGALLQIFGAGFLVRTQLPFVAPDESEPEPDAAVVVGAPRDFVRDHPSQAVLVVEVSDSTLAYDLGAKASLYAQANIEEYWVVDIPNRLLHVHRTPIALPSLPNGFGFQTISRFSANDFAFPLAAPNCSVQVADLLP